AILRTACGRGALAGAADVVLHVRVLRRRQTRARQGLRASRADEAFHLSLASGSRRAQGPQVSLRQQGLLLAYLPGARPAGEPSDRDLRGTGYPFHRRRDGVPAGRSFHQDQEWTRRTRRREMVLCRRSLSELRRTELLADGVPGIRPAAFAAGKA